MNKTKRNWITMLLQSLSVMRVSTAGGQVIMVVFLAWTASADVWWAGGTGDFGTAANWGLGVLPGSGDGAVIKNNGHPSPSLPGENYTVNIFLDVFWAPG